MGQRRDTSTKQASDTQPTVPYQSDVHTPVMIADPKRYPQKIITPPMNTYIKNK